MRPRKSNVSIDSYKVCFVCKEKEGIRYTYKKDETDTAILFKREVIESAETQHENCYLLEEAREELDLLEVIVGAKRQQITDLEWKLFKTQRERK